ncbi:S26 family signal peptidase [Halopiger djelfimassiliensis]|uniref:S26 family signal peptidase n=1 Tax=Halopiger djelfimassiliensis TaxID=1293047 RepID=UPI000677E4F6|nr:S26 family signal peptidase [Halopiger djelfimassiliensis]
MGRSDSDSRGASAADDRENRSDAEIDPRTETGDGPATSDASGRGSASRSETTENGDRETVTIEDDGIVRWFLRSEDDTVVVARDVLSGVALVVVLGLVLFAISGIWPPLVVIESPSMTPNMQTGDLVFVVDDDRFVGDDHVDGTGIVPRENGVETGHEKFGDPGDVIVFKPDGSESRTPVIHRAHFWVEEGENWVETKADPVAVDGRTCDELAACPAPHDGFVTKGDANGGYDQLPNRGAETTVIKPEWVTGKAMVRAPWIGYLRLTVESKLSAMGPSTPAAGPLETGRVTASGPGIASTAM